ncbi:MAG: hypothetical protein IPN17_26975 [Deltaproteobacteria bacterium]|nr:hypothetical protein [Deltaproteobacteria bacterium]
MALVHLAGMSAIAVKEFRFALVAVSLVTAAVGARPLDDRGAAPGAGAHGGAVGGGGRCFYPSGYCQGDLSRAARWAGGRADLRELVMMNASHPARDHRAASRCGATRKEQRSRTAAVAAPRGRGWQPAGALSWCDERRGPCLDEPMLTRGMCGGASRRAVVIARPALTGRSPGDHASGSPARE